MRDNAMPRRRFLTAAGALGLAGAAGVVATSTACATTSSAAPQADPAMQHAAGLMTLIGSYTSASPAGRGLEVAIRNDAGVLEPSGVVDGVPDASFFAWSPDHKYLYVTNEVPEGTITAVDLSGHHPMVLGSQPTGGAGPTHLTVHPSGEFIFTANYTDGTVSVHRRNADGTIGESTDLVKHPGAEPHAHQVLVDPSKQWVVAVDLGADAVFVYAFDAATGKLTQHQHLELPTGTGPRHLAFNYDRAYLLAELKSEITVLDWDLDAGQFTPGQVVGTREPDASGENFPAEIAITRDAKFAYATNRGDNNIATFAITGEGLEFRGTTPVGGDWPRHFALDPEQTSLYVANQRSGAITRLTRDAGSGALSPTQDVYECPSVAAVTFHG
ncbi:lactonase family protein [Saccharopolyspora sp. WRP15-2]|uniref:Lactonase family protein n=1 Tax=Saccharopolyspora oryzae TaxID=2997343 RepID=A0ABT4V719_9PSEU|nr:lactonase family protein [Saccharopolyspora oryzae]MDA3629169.1 lactonase family protein [Saccharopolyspora oryzae]